MRSLEDILKQTRMVDNSKGKAGNLHGLVDLINHVGGLEGKRGLEVGCYRGVSSEVFLYHKPAKMDFVDVWGKHKDYKDTNWIGKIEWGKIKNQFEERIKPFHETTDITVYHNFSHVVAQDIPDNTYDFIYIDGEHTYKAMKQDIESWYPKLGKGGYFCGHDIDTKGVSKAMFERFDPKDIATFSETSFALLK